jgi:hypothetical protein
MAIGNAPASLHPTSAAVVRYGPKGAGAARTVAAYVPGSTLKLGGAKGSEVTLVLGKGYRGIASAKQVKAALAVPPTPVPTCHFVHASSSRST